MARRKLKVLFVDDDEAVRETWRYCFGEDFDATIVGSGAEALRLLESPPGGQPFDVLVADHRMPEMTGAELCWKAKEIAPDTARVIMTAFRDREARLCPCDTVLEKPDLQGKLPDVIRAAHGANGEVEVRRREREAEKAFKSARNEFREATERLRSWIPLPVEKER